MKLFGSSGIRDVVNRGFLELTYEVGLAAGNLYRSVIVGCDTRTSSDAVRYAFISGLLSAGSAASDAGVVTTPTLAYTSRKFEAGVMITASHNPPEYNGIKLINPDGSAFHASQREEIEGMLEAKSSEVAPWEAMKNCTAYPGAIDEHLERILADFNPKLKLRVVVDCGGGTACSITPRLLASLGCDVVTLHCEPAGHPPRASEPTPENLERLALMVKDTSADLGIAHDGDADRIAVIDDLGRFVPPDKLMALLARDMGAKKIVTTADASMLIDEIGFEVIRTKVGDAFVSDELIKGGEFGGESSGCYIFPSISLCPDAIYAAATIARLANADKISTLVDQIPSYPVLRGGIAGDRAVMAKLEERLRGEAAQLDTTDGLKVYFADGWLLVRPSGTEPKIRITAEAKSEQRARELYELGTKYIKECLKEQERAII
ncbi:phosphoglucosamine mutase [Chloroflexota bacterium]